MARLLLIVCAILAIAQAPAWAQTAGGDSPPTAPSARLIKPRAGKSDTHASEKAHHNAAPIDDRCKPLKQELETALQKQGNAHRLFQARVAHNAGDRLCRDGQAEKGMAELRKGLSYLEERRRR
jgi:hypothetical protein